ncbi:MAG: TonB-dependent receptor [Tenuifilaceae bacterium]|nr:TonB-dependent receptor [Tenuifilaceae bacterium]
MRLILVVLWPLITCTINPTALYAHDTAINCTINGYVSDVSNGETLIGATVSVKELGIGVTSNAYGYYALTLPMGHYTLTYSFVGYAPFEKKVDLKKNTTISVELSEKTALIEEVVIVSQRPNANVTKAEMSVVQLDIKTIRRMPSLMGEVDIIKSLQLLPGVQSTSEGTSGFSVRGGAMDHNLILLDEATVYNASHLMGFFSVFNNDAIKDVKLYKGDIPASSGGRLASLLDVRMKEGNSKAFAATGGIGTISSRLTIEGPIISENTTFVASGRRTYADLFLPLAPNEDIRDNQLFFYDLNLKINHKINDNNRLYLSGYLGRDIFKNEFAKFGFGNQTLTFRWNHLFGPKLFLNSSVIFSSYDYYLGTGASEASSFVWYSNMEDYSAKFDFTNYLSSNSTLRFGIQSTHHTISPGVAKGVGSESILDDIVIPNSYSFEHGLYAQNEQSIGSSLTLKYGLRLSALQNIGEAKVYSYNSNYETDGFATYGKGETYNTYVNLEPRLGFVYQLSQKQSIKGSYSRTAQYIQLASNSEAGTPLDIWFAASPNVKPQLSDQWALGFFRNFFDNRLETSVEAYYKNMRNVVDFKEFANMLLNEELEGELRTGTAQSYGIEFLAQFGNKKINGWVSYTYSRAFRTIDGINSGNPYPAPYDKPHDISVVFNYELSPKLSLSANWVYATGVPATFPAGRYEILGTIIPLYTGRNSYRYPDYHRLDLALSYRPRAKSGRKWRGEWNLSVYNAYNRKNAWTINFVQDSNNPNLSYAEKTYLFSIVPAITYNFKF